MKKLLGFVTLAGLLFTTAAVQAQTWQFDVSPSMMGNPSQPVEGASGTYHVVISQGSAADLFNVQIYGNADGNTQDAPLGQPSPTPDPPVAKSGIGRISLNFYRTVEGGIDGGLDQRSGSTDAYSGPGAGIGVMNNVGGPRNLAFGSGGGAWLFNNAPDTTIVFTTFDVNAYVAPHGGNSFTGSFQLETGDWARVGVALQDSGQQWSTEYIRPSLVPESSSLALLLPGLLPLALVLRARRRKA